MAQNAQNLVRFLATFSFDREYLRNGSTNRKSEKYLINYISSPIGRSELWSTNNKVIDAHVDPPKLTFFRILNFGPWWVLVSEIFTLARHWPMLASAHHKADQGSPQNFIGEHLQLGLKFHICVPITLEVVGVTLRNFTRGCGSQPG